MGSVVVVVKPPTVDDPAGLGQAQEQLAVEKLITQLSIEALYVTILIGRSWRRRLNGDAIVSNDLIESVGGRQSPLHFASSENSISVTDRNKTVGI
ncbi:hypothetical protein HG15A2_25910 [Adhaeretor mobilis]|uniref:Uncharacterized protein n=1 Tax=Adhaeretor mobilis TaxID=1930276 RepID=A0A517MWM5_9BACT|nr:hypothetical protein HG15A2_25910 [Adhaeretor mobilis]